MARPSLRKQRRQDIALAFERALAKHGLGGATMVAIAEEAGIAPGLIHHHFRDREDIVAELVRTLIGRFHRLRTRSDDPAADLVAYTDAALALRNNEGQRTAKAWVGLFAEGIRSRRVQGVLRRALQRELRYLEAQLTALGLSAGQAEQKAAGILSLVVGCLVFGALLPGQATGFAAPFAREILDRYGSVLRREIFPPNE